MKIKHKSKWLSPYSYHIDFCTRNEITAMCPVIDILSIIYIILQQSLFNNLNIKEWDITLVFSTPMCCNIPTYFVKVIDE